jgi:pimeloyl-ACP methyl ester carboxylesterase
MRILKHNPPQREEARMLELPSRYVETAGYRTHYVTAGSGQPVLLIHGGGAGADGLGNWQKCIPLYAPHFQVYAYDMVGFGKSDAPDVATFAYDKHARTEQAIALIEALGKRQVSLVGNSMGGAVALGVAMRRPDLLRNIVLMSSAGLNRKVPPAIAAGATSNVTRETIRAVIRGLTLPGFEIDETLVEYRFNLLKDKPDKQAAYVKTMQAIVDAGGLYYEEDEIAQIKTRALVFHGRDDKAIPMREGLRLLELLSEAEGHFIPHCGHWAMIEQTETFVRVSRDFLLASQDL